MCATTTATHACVRACGCERKECGCGCEGVGVELFSLTEPTHRCRPQPSSNPRSDPRRTHPRGNLRSASCCWASMCWAESTYRWASVSDRWAVVGLCGHICIYWCTQRNGQKSRDHILQIARVCQEDTNCIPAPHERSIVRTMDRTRTCM